MKRKKLSLEEIISSYKDSYDKKDKLTDEELENLISWSVISQLNEEIEDIKPLVMGGFPRLIYDAITPYYQIIASIFLIIGTLLMILSVVGLYITSNSSLVGYMFPALISTLFGVILVFFPCLRRPHILSVILNLIRADSMQY